MDTTVEGLDVTSNSKGAGLYIGSRDTNRNKFSLVDVETEVKEANTAVSASIGRDAPYSSDCVEQMKMGTLLFKLARAGRPGMRSTVSGVANSPHILRAKRTQDYGTIEWQDLIQEALILDMWSQIKVTGVAMDQITKRYNMQEDAFGYYRGFVPVRSVSTSNSLANESPPRLSAGKMACAALPESDQGSSLVLKVPSGGKFVKGDEEYASNRQQMAKSYVKMLCSSKKDHLSSHETHSDLGLQVLCYKIKAILEIHAARTKSSNVFTKDGLDRMRGAINLQREKDEEMGQNNNYNIDEDVDEEMTYDFVDDDITGEEQINEMLDTEEVNVNNNQTRRAFSTTFHNFVDGGYLLTTIGEGGVRKDKGYSLNILRRGDDEEDDRANWYNQREYYVGTSKSTPYRYMENARNSIAASFRLINAHFRQTIVGYTASGINGNGMITLSITQ